MQRLNWLLVATLVSSVSCKKDEIEADPFVETGPSGELDIEITEPPAGAHVAVGPLSIKGTQTGLSNVTLNGDAIQAATGTFDVDATAVRGINAFEARGEKGTTFRMVRRSVLAGTFADASGPIDEAIGIRLNQGGLDAMGGIVGGLLDPAALSKGLAGGAPVYESFVIDLYVNSIGFSPLQLDLVPATGKLDVELVLPDLDLVLGADALVDFDVFVTADEARVYGVMTLGTDGNGHLTAEFFDPSVQLINLDFDTSLLPGDNTFGVESLLEGTVEGLLVDQIEALVPPLLADQLSTLDLAFELDLLGTPVSIATDFRGAGIDVDGVQLVADLDVDVASNGTKVAPGFLKADAGRPAPNRVADLSMSLSDDLVNRLLFEAWSGGMIDLVLTTEDESLPSAYLESFGTDTGTLSLDPKLPPVLVQTGEVTELQIGELLMRLDTPTNSQFTYIDLALSAKIPVDLEVENGELTIALGTPDLNFIVRDTDWDVDNDFLTAQLEEKLPIASLIALFGNFSFELPSLAGITLENASIHRDSSEVFTNIAAEL